MYSDDNINWTRVNMRSDAHTITNVNRDDYLQDGNIRGNSNGLRFQWTNCYRAEVSYLMKHRYWKVDANTYNISDTDSFILESYQ